MLMDMNSGEHIDGSLVGSRARAKRDQAPHQAGLAAALNDRFAGAGPSLWAPSPGEPAARKVRCLTEAGLASGRPWASNLRGALRVDDASPTVPVRTLALLSLTDHERPFETVIIANRFTCAIRDSLVS